MVAVEAASLPHRLSDWWTPGESSESHWARDTVLSLWLPFPRLPARGCRSIFVCALGWNVCLPFRIFVNANSLKKIKSLSYHLLSFNLLLNNSELSNLSLLPIHFVVHSLSPKEVSWTTFAIMIFYLQQISQEVKQAINVH